MNVPPRLRGAPALALSCVFFAAMAVVAKAASTTLSPAQLVAGRFLIGVFVVLVIFAASRTRPVVQRPLIWAQRGFLGGASVLCWFYGMKHIGVGPATLLNFTSPVYAAVFGVFFLKEKAKPRLWMGLVFASIGASLVLVGAAEQGGQFRLSLGLGAAILAGVLAGGAHTTVVALRAYTDAVTVFFSFSLFGFLFALPFALATWKPVGLMDVLVLLLVGGLAAAGQLLMTYAYGFVTASAGSIWMQLTPVLSWVMAVLFLGEVPNRLATAGAILTIAAVLFATGVVGQRRTAISSEPPSAQ